MQLCIVFSLFFQASVVNTYCRHGVLCCVMFSSALSLVLFKKYSDSLRLSLYCRQTPLLPNVVPLPCLFFSMYFSVCFYACLPSLCVENLLQTETFIFSDVFHLVRSIFSTIMQFLCFHLTFLQVLVLNQYLFHFHDFSLIFLEIN